VGHQGVSVKRFGDDDKPAWAEKPPVKLSAWQVERLDGLEIVMKASQRRHTQVAVWQTMYGSEAVREAGLTPLASNIVSRERDNSCRDYEQLREMGAARWLAERLFQKKRCRGWLSLPLSTPIKRENEVSLSHPLAGSISLAISTMSADDLAGMRLKAVIATAPFFIRCGCQPYTKEDLMSDLNHRVTVRLSNQEAHRLQRLTRETATTPVEVIRLLIRNAETAQLEQLFRREQR
jgi:hypothetical protein